MLNLVIYITIIAWHALKKEKQQQQQQNKNKKVASFRGAESIMSGSEHVCFLLVPEMCDFAEPFILGHPVPLLTPDVHL